MKDISQLDKEKADYILASLPYHLQSKDDMQRFNTLLSNFDFLQEKLKVCDIQSLIDDIEHSDDLGLRQISKALRLSTHILITDIYQLKNLLIGRLHDTNIKRTDFLEKLLQSINKWDSGPYLRIISTSPLETVSSLMEATIPYSGQFHLINKISITADNSSIIIIKRNIIEYQEIFGRNILYKVLPPHVSNIQAISANGKRIVNLLSHREEIKPNKQGIAEGEAIFEIWDIDDSKLIATLYDKREKIYTNIWTVAVSANGDRVVTANSRTIKIWDGNSGILIDTIQTRYPGRIESIATDSNCESIFYISDWSMIFEEEQILSLWEIVFEDSKPKELYICSMNFPGKICYSSMGRQLVVAALYEFQVINRITSGKYELMVRLRTPRIDHLALSREGNLAITGFLSRFQVWNLAKVQNKKFIEDQNLSVNCINVAEKGDKIVYAVNNECQISDSSLNLIGKFAGNTSFVSWISISTDGCLLAVVSSDNSFRLWDLNTNDRLSTMESNTGGRILEVGFLRDTNYLVSVQDDRSVKIWDPASRRVINKVNGSDDPAISVKSALAHRERLAYVSWHKTKGNSVTGVNIIRVVDLNDLKIIREVSREVVQPVMEITHIILSQDELLLALVFEKLGTKGSIIEIWDKELNLRIGTQICDSRITCISFYPNTSLVFYVQDDGYAKVWDYRSDDMFTVYVFDWSITSCAINLHNSSIIVGDSKSKLSIMELHW